MDEQTRQAAGYLCRWMLLAASAGVVVAFAWVAAAGLPDVAAGEKIDVVLVDQIWRPRRPIRAFGYLTPVVPPEAASLFAVTGPGSGVWLAQAGRGTVSTYLHDSVDSEFRPLAPGAECTFHILDIRGLMYGTFAFEQSEALVAVVAPAREVFAIDGRLLEDAAEGDVRRAVKAMDGRGQVALFHPGWADRPRSEQMDMYRALRAKTRDRLGRLPVVVVFGGSYGEMSPVMQMDWTLGRQRAALLAVVTGSPALAEASAGRGFPTYFVGAGPPPVASPQLTVHRNLEELAAWLENH
jgi:hypothetical protein